MRKYIALTAALLVAAAWAIEPPKPQAPATPPKAEEPAPKPETAEPATGTPPAAEAPPAEPEVEEELPPLPPDAVPSGPPPQRFTPTEKVRADFPVSFPIDI